MKVVTPSLRETVGNGERQWSGSSLNVSFSLRRERDWNRPSVMFIWVPALTCQSRDTRGALVDPCLDTARLVQDLRFLEQPPRVIRVPRFTLEYRQRSNGVCKIERGRVLATAVEFDGLTVTTLCIFHTRRIVMQLPKMSYHMRQRERSAFVSTNGDCLLISPQCSIRKPDAALDFAERPKRLGQLAAVARATIERYGLGQISTRVVRPIFSPSKHRLPHQILRCDGCVYHISHESPFSYLAYQVSYLHRAPRPMPLVGSSMDKSCGSPSSAYTRPSRCFMPKGRGCGTCCLRAARDQPLSSSSSSSLGEPRPKMTWE